MIIALVTGSLFRAPESRASKNGRPFVSATVRVKDGEGSQFVRVAAFSESARVELLRLADGDSLSVQGPLTASIYTASDGNAKISLSIVANCVLALRQPPKERNAKGTSAGPAAVQDARSRQKRCAGAWISERDGPHALIDEARAVRIESVIAWRRRKISVARA